VGHEEGEEVVLGDHADDPPLLDHEHGMVPLEDPDYNPNVHPGGDVSEA